MRKRYLGLAAVLAAATAIAVSPAAAANVDCGPAGGIVTGTVTGNVYVGSGVICVVAAAHVTGSVTVQTGGALVLLGSQVDRSVQSAGAAWLVIAGSNTVRGSVQVAGTTGLPPGLTANPICTTTIGGTLMLTGNKAVFAVGCSPGAGNTIGSAMIAGNTGAVTLQYNTVTGSAICTGTPPVTGTGNTAARKLGCP